MSAFARFATADCFCGQYKDRTVFIAALLGRLQVEAKKDGWPGTAIFDADWIEARGQPDMAVISLQPGMGTVSVADVRIFLIDKKRTERKAA
jgi:hypothetical protein